MTIGEKETMMDSVVIMKGRDGRERKKQGMCRKLMIPVASDLPVHVACILG